MGVILSSSEAVRTSGGGCTPYLVQEGPKRCLVVQEGGEDAGVSSIKGIKESSVLAARKVGNEREKRISRVSF